MSDEQRKKERCETCKYFEKFSDYYEDPQEDHEGGMCKLKLPHSPVGRDGFCSAWNVNKLI